MAVKIRPKETRFLGWNAIQRTKLAEWFKERAARTPTESRFRDASEEGKDKSERSKLEETAEESHSVLAEARTVFPFTLFPDIITIDRHKLTVVHRSFFEVEQTVAVPIENIKNIESNHGPFFGSLTVTSDHFVNNTQTLNYLRRSDAQIIQKLVQGAIVAVKEGINISEVPTKKLYKLLVDLGKGHLKGD